MTYEDDTNYYRDSNAWQDKSLKNQHDGKENLYVKWQYDVVENIAEESKSKEKPSLNNMEKFSPKMENKLTRRTFFYASSTGSEFFYSSTMHGENNIFTATNIVGSDQHE